MEIKTVEDLEKAYPELTKALKQDSFCKGKKGGAAEMLACVRSLFISDLLYTKVFTAWKKRDEKQCAQQEEEKDDDNR